MRNSNFTNNTKDILEKCANKKINKEMWRKIFLLFLARSCRDCFSPLVRDENKRGRCLFPYRKAGKTPNGKKYELPA